MKTILRERERNEGTIQIKVSKSIKRTNLGLSQHLPSEFYNWSSMQAYINSHFEYSQLELFSYLSLLTVVMPQFDWLCDVYGYVMSLTSSIYWVDLGFINNYKKSQLWLILLRYSVDVVSTFPWDSSHTHTHHTINQIGASQQLIRKQAI